MMIIDFSNICIASLFTTQKNDEGFSEDYFRHIVLNSIRKIRKQFRKYGEVVVAVDSTNSWRKEVFPYYKASRKKIREDSAIDWNLVYATISKLVAEIRDNFPYKVIKVDRCEADDIIGVLARHFSNVVACSDNKDNIVIISADKDMIQLQKYPNVKQYNPIQEKWIEGNGEQYLFEHILRGDTGDGVPNFLSAGSCLVEKVRQKPVMQKKVDALMLLAEPEFIAVITEMGVLDYYNRNKLVIDLTNTPEELYTSIMNAYAIPPVNGDLANYFRQYKLKNLYEYINEF